MLPNQPQQSPQHHGQQYEDEGAEMEGQSDEVEQNEGQHHEVEQDEMVASQGHDSISPEAKHQAKLMIQYPKVMSPAHMEQMEMFDKKLAYMEKRAMMPPMSSGSEMRAICRGDAEKFRVIADEFEKAIAARDGESGESEDEIESGESERKTEDYGAWVAESVEPEHFLCHEGDQPVLVYDLYNVPNKQLVAELARRLGD